MINLLSTMSSTASAGSHAATVDTVSGSGRANPLDDTIAVSSQPNSDSCIRVLEQHKPNKSKVGKKASVELVPIVSAGPSSTGGYVNEAIEDRTDSKESLDKLVQEYRIDDSDDDDDDSVAPFTLTRALK